MFLKQIVRLFFILIVIFELLNFFDVFNVDLHFSWLTLVAMSGLGLIFYELVWRYLDDSAPAIIAGFITWLALFFDDIGNFFSWYSNVFWYDKMTHFLGGAAAGAGVFIILKALNQPSHQKFWSRGKIGNKFLILFSFALANLIAVLYELEEYFEDLLTGSRKIGSGFDTIDDLLWDLLGIVLGLIIARLMLKSRNKMRNID